MFDKRLYDSWKSRMELYMQNREHGRMILESVEHGPLIWPTVKENGVIRTKKYVELSAAEKVQADLFDAYNAKVEGHMLGIASSASKRQGMLHGIRRKAISLGIFGDQAQNNHPLTIDRFQTEDLIDNQSVQALQDFEQTPVMDFTDI
ncbi:hypothetical protein Tco_1392016 [Tanacetum coccineum]|uniref:Integrase, catalytic region, zinc finger, CCHC-type, peptidase aspartic, catalytic n=1 Tax=Tanacetum coccineum TaxID=301880 RepID=A0ABQ5BHJ5_9ASTR